MAHLDHRMITAYPQANLCDACSHISYERVYSDPFCRCPDSSVRHHISSVIPEKKLLDYIFLLNMDTTNHKECTKLAC